MKYPPEAYAEAFAEALEEKSAPDSQLIKRFLSTIDKNGDWPSVKKIFNLIVKKIVKRSGGRSMSAEFAREMPKAQLENFLNKFSKKDFVEVAVKPELVGGVRILIDGEEELDLTMARKLKILFK